MIWGWVQSALVTALVWGVPVAAVATASVGWLAWRRRNVDRPVDLRGVDLDSTVQLPAVRAGGAHRRAPSGGRTPLSHVIRHTCRQIEAIRRG